MESKMKTVILFDLRAAERRRIEKAIGQLDQFAQNVFRTVARDDERARETIVKAQRAAKANLRFLVIDEAAFVAGWGIIGDDIAFGGPFRAA